MKLSPRFNLSKGGRGDQREGCYTPLSKGGSRLAAQPFAAS